MFLPFSPCGIDIVPWYSSWCHLRMRSFATQSPWRSPLREGRKRVNLRKYHEQLVKDFRSCTFPGKHPSFLFEKCEINGKRYETNRTSLVAFKKWNKNNKQTKKQANKQTIFVSLNMLYSAKCVYSRFQQTLKQIKKKSIFRYIHKGTDSIR